MQDLHTATLRSELCISGLRAEASTPRNPAFAGVRQVRAACWSIPAVTVHDEVRIRARLQTRRNGPLNLGGRAGL